MGVLQPCGIFTPLKVSPWMVVLNIYLWVIHNLTPYAYLGKLAFMLRLTKEYQLIPALQHQKSVFVTLHFTFSYSLMCHRHNYYGFAKFLKGFPFIIFFILFIYYWL